MASVNFEKLKDVSTIKAKIRHCNKEERLIHTHSNKHKQEERSSFMFWFEYTGTGRNEVRRYRTILQRRNKNFM